MGKSGKCELHGTKLEWKSVPIRYGYPGYDESWAVEKDLFPNAFQYLLGGCVVKVGPDGKVLNEERERVLICRDCRAAKAEWLRQTKSAELVDRCVAIGLLEKLSPLDLITRAKTVNINGLSN